MDWLKSISQKQFALVDQLVAYFNTQVENPAKARSLLKILKQVLPL